MKFGVLASAAAFLLSAGAAFATGDYYPPDQVPEIDVLSGFGAVAAIGAASALLWERRRR
jgi:hypothetical protein